MQIIGEKINGTRKQVAQAVAERDVAFIQNLAERQVQAGAHFLDVNAGTPPVREPDDLVWLVETVQSVVDVPLCLDSANPAALSAAAERVKKTPLINSINGEPERLNGVLPIVVAHGCGVIALAMATGRISPTVQERMAVIRQLMETLRGVGVPDEKVYLDPLVMTISTAPQGALVALDTLRAAHAEFPAAHLVAGLSNVSFGMPARGLINRTFLTLALAAGLDCAILDPLDRELRAAMLATDLLLARDPHCQHYLRAFRAGLLKPQK